MSGIVIYGTGSPILVDIEESLWRAGISVRVGIRNHAGRSYLTQMELEIEPAAIAADLLALPFLVPLFTPAHRQTAANEALTRGFASPFKLLDPTVTVPRSIVTAPGSYVGSGATLGGGSQFGAFNFINRGACIGHHFQSAAFVSVGPGAVIAGEVTVGRGAVIGAGAIVLPKIKIGANAVVGAGAVVTRDVAEHTLVVGNPARITKTGIPGFNGKAVI